MNFPELCRKNNFTEIDISDVFCVGKKKAEGWFNGTEEPDDNVIKMLEERLSLLETRQLNAEKFTFIDLFAGIGGLRKGFESIGGKCVFTSEWDKYAQKTYRANFPGDDHEILGDIKAINKKNIPAHDVLLAGFPCQPFSIAGVSKKNSLGRAHGFMDETQGTLFFDVLEILNIHRPAAFLLENVKNLISHDKGNTFRVIQGSLEELGYTISYRIIDAKGYVPQHRERIFIVGFKNTTDFDLNACDFNNASKGPDLKTILHDETESPEADYVLPREDKGANAFSAINDKYTLTDKLWAYLQEYAAKHKAAGNGFGYGLNGPEDTARTLSARYYKDGSEILIRQENEKNPRRLTPRECARIMGFDDNRYKNKMIIPVSDTRAYKQFGNSVVVPVIKAIAENMKDEILNQIEHS